MMKSEQLSTAEMSELTGLSKQGINKAAREGRLHRDPVIGKFDPSHSVNAAFIESARAANGVDSPPPDIEGADPRDAESIGELYRVKIGHEIERIQAQTEKLRLANAEAKGELVSIDAVEHGWGAWASAVRDNILTIGQKVSRGDTQLRDRIEKETSRALRAAKLRAEGEILRYEGIPEDRIAAFFAEEDENND